MIQTQTEMEFLWPHYGIQLSLDLDYPEQKTTEDTVSYSFSSGYRADWGNSSLGMTTISPSLTVSPTNSVGELKIGVMHIGIEKKPSVLQKVLYKLLGFKWSEGPEK